MTKPFLWPGLPSFTGFEKEKQKKGNHNKFWAEETKRFPIFPSLQISFSPYFPIDFPTFCHHFPSTFPRNGSAGSGVWTAPPHPRRTRHGTPLVWKATEPLTSSLPSWRVARWCSSRTMGSFTEETCDLPMKNGDLPYKKWWKNGVTYEKWWFSYENLWNMVIYLEKMAALNIFKPSTVKISSWKVGIEPPKTWDLTTTQWVLTWKTTIISGWPQQNDFSHKQWITLVEQSIEYDGNSE